MRWPRDARVHVAVLGAILISAQVLTACRQADPGTPRANEVADTVGGNIEIWEDPSRGVVCYIWDGYQAGSIDCLELAP